MESVDILNEFQSLPQNPPKAFILEEDNAFLYKKVENFVIVKFPVTVKPEFSTFNPEKDEMCFAFVMKTSSQRAKKENFEMTVPIFINLGK